MRNTYLNVYYVYLYIFKLVSRDPYSKKNYLEHFKFKTITILQ